MLVLGVVGGVAIAIALSIGVFLYRSTRPHDAMLGRSADIDGYHDVVNAEYLRTRVLSLADEADGLAWLVLNNAEGWTFLDATAIDVLARLQGELAEREIVLGFARLKGREREIFAETGLTDLVGADRFLPTVRAAVAAYEGEPRASERSRAARRSRRANATPGTSSAR